DGGGHAAAPPMQSRAPAPGHNAHGSAAPHAPPGSGDLEDLALDRPEEPKKHKKRAPPPAEGLELPPMPQATGGGAAGGPDALGGGEIRRLPRIWQRYRKPIIGSAGVVAVFLGGFFTHIWHPCGA